MEKQTVYKVLHEDEHRLVSSCVDKRWQIEYYIDVFSPWIKPKDPDSYIFAFESLEEALSFYYRLKRFDDYEYAVYEIWECKARGVVPAPEYVVNLIFNKRREIKKFWKLFNRGASIEEIKERVKNVNVRVPDGTVLCKEIMLIRKVY